jgi:uncharacterized protein
MISVGSVSAMADPGTIRVEVVYALADRSWRVDLLLPEGARVADAVAAADMPRRVAGIEIDPTRLAVHGRLVTADEQLQDGDRVELLRPLLADPKEVRRRRARQG